MTDEFEKQAFDGGYSDCKDMISRGVKVPEEPNPEDYFAHLIFPACLNKWIEGWKIAYKELTQHISYV